MATTGAMLCWLTHDTYAVMRITEEIEKLGVYSGAGCDDFQGDAREDAGRGGGHESERDHRG
jgi:hypothetical protein